MTGSGDPSGKISRFFESLRGKRIAFIGIGVTNNDTIRLFAEKGLDVTVCDRRPRDQAEELCREFERLGAAIRFGDDYLEGLEGFDVLFRAPGVYFLHPALQRAREKGCTVTSEMETFFDLCPCKTYAVTGSDGKTTTTSLIARIFKEDGKTVHLGGNIGKALLPAIETISPDDRAVVELSSFQLLSMRQPIGVTVITNVAPNHLDVHKTMEEYVGAKKHIFLHQNAFSKTVLNSDNETTSSFMPMIRGKGVWFSRLHPVESGAFLDSNGNLCAADRGKTFPLIPAGELRIPGMHNIENALAAISAVWGDADPEAITRALREFTGVEHRIEFVRELDGVKWYNDTIASSPTRVIAGLKSFDRPVILIAGGYNKKIPFEPMAPLITQKVRTLILMGVTAQKIEDAVKRCPQYDPQKLEILHASGMEDAVEKARGAAEKGDIITLSPACASFDMYPNFEARGNHFKALVNALS